MLLLNSVRNHLLLKAIVFRFLESTPISTPNFAMLPRVLNRLYGNINRWLKNISYFVCKKVNLREAVDQKPDLEVLHSPPASAVTAIP